LEKCSNCSVEFDRVPFDGKDEPITIQMVDYGEGVDRLYSFCSKRCHAEWEEEHPLDEA